MIMVIIAIIFIIMMLLLLMMMMLMMISHHEIHTGYCSVISADFLTERSCAAQISKVECHGISDSRSYYNE